VRIRTLHAVLLAGVLVLPACGSADQVVAPPGVAHQTRIVRAQLRPAGWRVTLVLPGHTTRICGDGRATVRMSVSAVASGVTAVAPIGHPHLTAWLFQQPQQAAACLSRFAVANGDIAQPTDGGLLVLHPLSGPQVAATAGRYFVIVSTSGPLAPMRRAAERALARL
jgi:hypothetical protein